MFIVTGTGRCGTGWAKTVLSQTGFDVTHQGIRHEHVLSGWPLADPDTPDRACPEDVIVPDVGADGDVSFEAAPIAGRLRARGWRVVLIHRDPVDVVKSWLSRGAFTANFGATHRDWYASITQHTPWVLTTSCARLGEPLSLEDRVRWATEWYMAWNQLVLPHADAFVRFDDELQPQDLLTAVGVAGSQLSGWHGPGRVDFGAPRVEMIHLGNATRETIRRVVHRGLGDRFDYREETE